MDSFSIVPPGFRFHPTEEELIGYYLRKKVASKRIDLDVIKEVDLYKIEPWDLQEICRIGNEDQDEWYFFSHKDKKYPTGSRTNRATKAGFWKATGRDKAIYSKHTLVGMRKTLVFYKGRAPNGQKSDWIMHEYRLETNELGTSQEEGWAVCRVFKKKMTAIQKMGGYETSPCNRYEDQMFFNAPELQANSSRFHSSSSASYPPQNPNFPCKQELESSKMTSQTQYHHDPLLFHLPQLESPQKIQQSNSYCNNMPQLNVPCGASKHNNRSSTISEYLQQEEVIHQGEEYFSLIYDQQDHRATDWRVLDKFVASQLSNEETAAGEDGSREEQNKLVDSKNFERLPQMGHQEYGKRPSAYASASGQTNLWK